LKTLGALRFEVDRLRMPKLLAEEKQKQKDADDKIEE
jgi:hypothetical protein